LVARRIGSSLLRQTFGARRGKRCRPIAQAGPKEQQRKKKSGPRRRFSGARRINDFGALREEQEPDGERRRKSSPGRIWRRETEQRQRDLWENSIRKERRRRGFVRSTNTGGGASPRKTRIGRRHREQTQKKPQQKKINTRTAARFGRARELRTLAHRERIGNGGAVRE
jgi:hypothetical protein